MCYWNTDGVTSPDHESGYFHSQYYQNKLYTNYNWATDNNDNFKTGFVYRKSEAKVWDLVVLKIPILG